MGWRRVAEEELPTLKPQTRQMLQAYADGVNTYLRGRSPGEVAVEYAILGLQLPTAEIEEWSPVDSLAWLKAMAWDLRATTTTSSPGPGSAGGSPRPRSTRSTRPTTTEAQPADPRRQGVVAREHRAGRRLRRAVGARRPAPARAATVRRPADVRRPRQQALRRRCTTALDRRPRSSSAAVRASAPTPGRSPARARPPASRCSPTTPTSRSASPASGSRTACSCRTVSPSCPLSVSGFSFAGVPGVVIGHNADIAWGFTNLGPDVSDFYLERVVGRHLPARRRLGAGHHPRGGHPGRRAAPTSGSPCAARCTAR